MNQHEYNTGGRPTKYKVEFNKQAYQLCLLGATDSEIAEFFEVNEDTVHEWKKVHPKFSESLKKGKMIADSKVAVKLYERATGYRHPDTDIRLFNGEVIKTDITKHYPPDTTAAIFWLKNRSKKKWRDKQGFDIDFESLTDEQLDEIIERLKKADGKT